EQLSPALAEIEVHLRKVQGRIEHVGGLATLQAGLEMAALDRPFGARRAGEQVVGKGGAHAKRGRATQKIAPAKLSLRDVSAEKFEFIGHAGLLLTLLVRPDGRCFFFLVRNNDRKVKPCARPNAT